MDTSCNYSVYKLEKEKGKERMEKERMDNNTQKSGHVSNVRFAMLVKRVHPLGLVLQ